MDHGPETWERFRKAMELIVSVPKQPARGKSGLMEATNPERHHNNDPSAE